MSIILDGSTGITTPNIVSPIQTISTKLDLTGGQIKFPAIQVASSDANTLDDYEEGTFTPTFSNFTKGDGVVHGNYTKIGNIVTVELGFVFGSSSSITGFVEVSGLPFVSKNINGINFASVQGQILDSGSVWYDIVGLFALSSSNNQIIFIRRAGTTTQVSGTQPMTWANTDSLTMNFIYITE